VPVTVSGKATDALSKIAKIQIHVRDEYGPAAGVDLPPVSVGAQPSPYTFSVTIQLTASRKGSDKDGRRYDVSARAQDSAGNWGAWSASKSVTAHDQSGK